VRASSAASGYAAQPRKRHGELGKKTIARHGTHGTKGCGMEGMSGSRLAAGALSRRGFLTLAAVGTLAGCARRQGTGSANTPVAHSRMVCSLAMSPDGTLLASSGEDGMVKLWSLPDGALLKRLTVRGDFAPHIAMSPDGKLLASDTDGSAARIWSLPDGELVTALDGHNDSVSSLVFYSEGGCLATSDGQGAVRLWRVSDWSLSRTIQTHAGSCFLDVSPDSKFLASGGVWNAKVWSLPDGAPIRTLEAQAVEITSLLFTPDSRYLATASNHDVHLWALPEGTLFRTLSGHDWVIQAIAVSQDGKRLASGDMDGFVRLWSLPDGKLLHALKAPANWASCLAFAPRRETLIVGCGDHSVRRWSVFDGKSLGPLPSGPPPATRGLLPSTRSLALGRNGTLLAAGSQVGTLRLWSLPEGKLLADLVDPEAKAKDA
jgi:WD40 repeat protein